MTPGEEEAWSKEAAKLAKLAAGEAAKKKKMYR